MNHRFLGVLAVSSLVILPMALAACGGVSTTPDGSAGATGSAGTTGGAGAGGHAGSGGAGGGTTSTGGSGGHAGVTGTGGAGGHAGVTGTGGTGGAGGHAGTPGGGGAGGTGGAAGGASGSGTCFDSACNGTCKGTTCNGAWTCDTAAQICAADIADYCGCDGETFQASSSCPDYAFAHRGACASTDISCDARKVECKSLPADCKAGEVPSVQGNCWGPCVAIAKCVCAAAADCPTPNTYTCHMNTMRCGPYVR